MESRRRGDYRELNYFNAFACLFVILIHVLSLGISTLRADSWQMAVIYFPWRLSAFVVPAFLFCGAVKMGIMFASGKTFRYGRYILRRFEKIYIPYIVANVVYYLAFMAIHYVDGFSLRELLGYILRGNLASPFYYVVIAMQFYLTAPLWKALVNKVPWYIGILSSLFITFLFEKLSPALMLFGIDFKYSDRVFPTYLWFWVTGLYAGARFDRVCAALRKSGGKILWCAAIWNSDTAVAYLQFASKRYIFDLNILKLVSDSAAVMLLLRICMYISDSRRERLKGALGKIYSASYFVYLSHCLFLTLGTVFLQRYTRLGTAPLLLCRAAICYTLPFVLYSAYKFISRRLKRPGAS